LSLLEVVRFVVPVDVVQKTERSLRQAGSEGYELFVLWSGVQAGPIFNVRCAHVPKQLSYRTKKGLLVRVEGEALHELNVWLYEHEEQLAVQVHAHPDDAFHSETDDAYAIAAQLGSLSLVAADFCRHGLRHPSSAAYRLTSDGWNETTTPVHELIDVRAA
jgi:hypothetical protein